MAVTRISWSLPPPNLMVAVEKSALIGLDFSCFLRPLSDIWGSIRHSPPVKPPHFPASMKRSCPLWCLFIALFSCAVYAQDNPLTISSPAPNYYTLSYFATAGRPFQLQSSLDLQTWVDLGPLTIGTGSQLSLTDGPLSNLKKFYHLRVGATRSGFDAYALTRDDDHSVGPVPLGFSVSFSGATFTECYVNNNGNITFGSALGTYTPEPLQAFGRKMLAAFWADIDTRHLNSSPVTYGTGTVNGNPAFGVNYVNVGYFSIRADKLNSSQLLIIRRSDTGAGNFDAEFNYNQIQWETGDASGGTNGIGGKPARVGVTNGVNSTIELTGSGQTLAFLDSNTTTGLIYKNRNSTLPGRYIFQIRNGTILGALVVNAGPDQTVTQNAVSLSGTAQNPGGGSLTVQWNVLSGPAGASFANPNALSTTITLPGPGTYTVQLTVRSVADPQISAADTMIIQR
jgi:hypothetical protein